MPKSSLTTFRRRLRGKTLDAALELSSKAGYGCTVAYVHRGKVNLVLFVDEKNRVQIVK